MTERLSFERPDEITAADKIANPQRYEQPKGRFLVFQRTNHTVVYKESKNGDFEHDTKRWKKKRKTLSGDRCNRAKCHICSYHKSLGNNKGAVKAKYSTKNLVLED